jgi:RHS repeat-associated protein
VSASIDQAGVLTTYFYDDRGLLHGLERGTSRYTVATDMIGTPRVVADSSGNVVRNIRHDSYGAALPDGTETGSAASFPLAIGFAGGIEDPVTGLVRFGERDYDTASGRWTARDPAGFSGSPFGLYRYAGGDPIDNRDPNGLWCVGGSLYLLFGGGATICHDDRGFTGCAEGASVSEPVRASMSPAPAATAPRASSTCKAVSSSLPPRALSSGRTAAATSEMHTSVSGSARPP